MRKSVNFQRERRKRRVRAKISGTSARPRLTVFRSNKHISAQLIDDEKGVTLLTVSDQHIKNAKGTKTKRALAVGKLLSDKAKRKKVKAVVFDRGAYRYHGRVKALADAARDGGLTF